MISSIQELVTSSNQCYTIHENKHLSFILQEIDNVRRPGMILNAYKIVIIHSLKALQEIVHKQNGRIFFNIIFHGNFTLAYLVLFTTNMIWS